MKVGDSKDMVALSWGGDPFQISGVGVHFTAFTLSVLKEMVGVPHPVTLTGLLARKCWMRLDFCHYCHQGQKRKERGAPKGSKRDGIHRFRSEGNEPGPASKDQDPRGSQAVWIPGSAPLPTSVTSAPEASISLQGGPISILPGSVPPLEATDPTWMCSLTSGVGERSRPRNVSTCRNMSHFCRPSG